MTLLYGLDASNVSSMFSDAGKTTQITDGGSVYTFVPKSGSSVTADAVQATSSKRPMYRSSYNSSGYAAVEFDGSNDELNVAHSTAFNVTAYDFVLVFTPINVTGQVLLFSKLTNTSWNDGLSMSRNGTTCDWGAPNYNSNTASGIYSSGTKILVWARVKLNGRFLYAATSGDFKTLDLPRSGLAGSSTSTSPLAIGGSTTAGGYYAAMALHELQIHECTESIQSFRESVRTLETKWGINTYSSRSKPQHPMYQQVIG